MNISKRVSIIRFKYHANMLNLCNAANQLKLLSDERAERACRHHVMEALECAGRLDKDLSTLRQKEEERD